MKIIELLNNIRLPVDNEEHELLKKINSSIFKRELSPREQVIAEQLVRKSVLRRYKQDGKIAFKKTTKGDSSDNN